MSLSQNFISMFRVHADSNRYAAMEGLRAYAVIVVFMVHGFGTYSKVLLDKNLNRLRVEQLDSMSDLLIFYFHRSHYGVDIFFLLSGFLIFRMVARANFNYWHFIFNRVRRIYPAFLVSMGLAIGVKLLLNPSFSVNSVTLLQNLFFLNGIPGANSIRAYNHPTWSLFFEFTFYLALPILVYGLRVNNGLRLIGFAAVWLVLSSFLLAAYARYAMFLAGAFIACASDDELKRMSGVAHDIVVLAVYLGTTLYFVFRPSFQQFIPVYAVSTSLLFVNTVYGAGFLNKIFSLKPLRYLGNISYSFYLVHVTAIAVVFGYVLKLLELQAGLSSLLLLLIGSFALATSISILLFVLVERLYFRHKS